MKLLLLDTCGPAASLALVDTVADEHRAITIDGRSASELLIPELGRTMAALGWTPEALEVVGVVAGPGSFTGARIGLAAAKGLCEAVGVGLVLVSRLEVLGRSAGKPETPVHALLSAGRGEFFYRRSAVGEKPLEALLGRNAVLEATGQGRVVACEDVVTELLPERDVNMVASLTAADALPLVLERVAAGTFDDVAVSDANYLRRTELEVLERLRLRAAARI